MIDVETRIQEKHIELTKTIQDTLKQGNNLLENSFYWKRALDWLDQQ